MAQPSRRADAARAPARAVTRTELAGVAALVALAAAIRALRWHVTAVMFNDGPVFLALAQSIAAGHWGDALAHPFHPLYPAAIAAAHALIPDWETAAVTVSATAGAAGVAALFAFVRQAFGRAEAFVAAALLTAHSASIEFAGDVQSEALYIALFVACVAVLWPAVRRGRARLALAAGLLAGGAYLVRPEGLGLTAVAAVLGAVEMARRRWSARGGALWLAALAAGTLLVAAPYAAWLRAETGSFTLSGKKAVGVVAGLEERPYQGADPLAANPQVPWQRDADDPPPGTRAHRDVQETSRGAALAAALGDMLRTHLRSLRHELLAVLVIGWLWLRPRPGARAAFVASIVGGYAIVLFLLAFNVGYVSARHTLPPLTVLLGHAAWLILGIGAAAARGLAGPAAARRRAAVVGLLLAVCVGIGLAKSLKPDRLDALAERRAGEWLRAQGVPVHALAARKRRVAYYADAPWVKLASAAFPDGLRALGASHLVLDEGDASEYPKLRPLGPPEMVLLHRLEAEGRSVAIYALEPAAR
jgi:hypothetical protein